MTLSNGDVLVAGGEGSSLTYLASAEIYDPTTNEWTAIASMREPRERAVAALLPDGDVLMAAGENDSGPLDTSEIYDPTTNAWTPTADLLIGREGPAGATLPSGEVLVAGGDSTADGVLSTSEIYDPSTNVWRPAANMFDAREGPSAAVLPNGAVLFVGGHNNSGALGTSEFFYSAPQATITGGEFGDQTVGDQSAAASLTVTNIGAQVLSITTATLGGGDPGDFSIAANGCAGARLAYRETCTITVHFTPVSMGTREATLTLGDNEPSTTPVALAGTGVEPVAGQNGSASPQGPAGSPG